MALWDELPAPLRETGALDPLQSALSAIDTSGLTPREVTDVDGTWSVRSVAVDVPALAGLQVDPVTGRWGGAGSSTPVELVGTTTTVSYGRHLTGPGGAEDGGWHLDLDVPGARLLVPQLRGAMLDGRGQLVADPANPQVRFVLPRVVVRTMQLSGGTAATRLRSASTSGNPVDDIYSVVRMTPGHALIGPGDTVGFAFRTAELDLSSAADPPGLPPGARAAGGEWQGLHLPEVRLFVAPDGLEGLAVSAGVRDLWIGIGEHAGVTGAFSAEVVNRGGSPQVMARFVTPAGRHVRAVAAGAVEVPDQSTFLVDASGGLAPLTTTIEVGGATVTGDRTTVMVPATGTVTLRVTVTDAAGHAAAPVDFGATRPATAEGAAASLSNPATVRQLTPEHGRVVIVAETATEVTVRLEPEAPADWTWPGGSSTGTARATVPLAAGATVAVSATTLQPADARTLALDCHFLFARPTPAQTGEVWWRNPANTGSSPAGSRTTPASGPSFHDVASARRADIGSTPLVVHGYASYEDDDSPTKRTSNHLLSERRRDAAVAILRDLGYTVTPGPAHGHGPARDGIPMTPGGSAAAPGASAWWLARAVDESPPAQLEVRAELSRWPALDPPAQRDPQPPATGRPDCFRRLSVEVELIRSTFVRLEIWGEFDVQTAVEAALDEGGEPPLGGRGPNPGDGLCAFRVRLRLATDQASWQVFAEFRALEADLDGLWECRSTDPGIDAGTLDVLGALAVTGPLAASAADLSPAAGTLVQLGAVALGASELIKTKVLTLHGAELVISDGIIAPDGSTTTETGTQVSVLLDVEVQFSFDLEVIRVPDGQTVRTRYQAVGVRSEWGTGTQTEYLPVPVFDPSRGYVLDIQPGSLVATPPLDEILRVLGVRVSRDNPSYLEVEAGIAVPLGPVTVDTIRVRARLDELDIQVTKLGASLDIPGTVHGSGSVELTDAGFKAAFDLTIVPLSIRAAAVLAIETKDGVTGLLIGVEVQFPVPLPLGNSGLGIYGLLGGVGINYGRLEDAGARVPALDWLMRQLGPPRRTVMHPDGWTHRAGSYAVAAGLLLGTMEGGFVLHLKGIILIEVPGPRLLLVMKADVLSLPPALGSTQEASFLAVLDIDFGAGTITLGVVASYTVERILRIHVPVTAFFDAQHPERWLVDLGTYDDRVTVEVLDVFTGTGYLMVHGDGIAIPPLPATTGLAVATGFHISAVLMGSKAVRLYVEAAAGFDAVLGLDPFFLAGKVYVRGELMLFIVSIGVSAELTLMVGTRIQDGVPRDDPYVHGEVCGRVDFFFFSVKGCVSLTIGSPPDPDLVPRDLVAGVSLTGRSPALVEGGGLRVTDAVVGEAAELVNGVVQGETPVVPLDAAPVVSFRVAPDAEGLVVLGQAPSGSSGAAGASAWRRIGDRWWAYRVTDVTLAGALTSGRTPSVWWTPSAPGSSTAEAPSLALLHWLPTPFTSTVTYGETLRTQVEHRWGAVCRPAAPPQEQLWTFLGAPLGPDPDGWLLEPVLWPDPVGLLRTSPAARRLRVTEPWRTGDPEADAVAGGEPAAVVGDAVSCPAGRSPAEDPFTTWAQGNGTHDPTTWAGARGAAYPDLAELVAGGATVNDVAARWQAGTPDPEVARLKGCEGQILAAPLLVGDTAGPLLGAEVDRHLVEEARDRTGWRPDPLTDAVALSLPEELVRAAVLLLVPAEHAAPLLVEVRTDEGDVLDRREVDSSTWVGPDNPLPDRWVDPDGPWATPVELVGRAAAKIHLAHQGQHLLLALLVWDDLPEGATTVAVGWAEEGFRDWPQRFWVVASSGLTRAEVLRHAYDETVLSHDGEALSTGLTEEPTDHALLQPGQTYEVRVTWTSDSETGVTMPTRAPAFSDPRTQTYRFATEPASQVPADLSPWLLDTNPGMGDAGVFCREPLRVTLSTQNVLRLFDAYAHRLEVTVLAASGDHPAPPGGGAPGSPLTLPLSPGGAGSVLQLRDNAVVLTPWDRAAGELAAGLECVPGAHVTREVEEIVLTYDLEPLTDYLLDIHAVPTGGGERRRVHRANFTTSRFDDLDHLASWIAPAEPEHRLVVDPAPLNSLPDRPTGREWDDAVQRAGLPVPQTPTVPRVEVWWSRDAVPQPVAVVVECSEQLVRDRVMPVPATAPADAVDPSHEWWVAAPSRWLDLRVAAPSPDPATAASVARDPVAGPGGTRVLVPLAAGQRGRRLTLELATVPDPLAADPGRSAVVVDITLTAAPWEVEL